ncbi:MAG: endonuclease MutS2 [Clostridia bacterium]|nr:endonuclease MutS2 [Clostridia bacterium]
MNKHLKAIEFDKILEKLAEHTSFDDARQLALSLEPSSGLFEVNILLAETSDAHSLSGRFGSPAFGSIHNMNSSLRRAEAGAVLTPLELLRIASLLRTIRTVSEWRNRSDSVETSLDIRFNALMPNKYLETKISSAILSEEEIADNASPTLSSIRKKIAAASAKIRERLDKIIHSSSMQKYLQDSIVTMRGGRFVIPVKAEFRANVPGLVHDTSSSGSTVFIEPMSVVEANNDIRVLTSKEQAEIERILAELSAEAGAYADSVSQSYNILTELNVIFAKAELAYSMKASLPVMNSEGRIKLKKARHPLIPAEKVVATDIELGTDFDTLVVTGPNTGGKTVSLKTIGLFSAMAMCGMMIPAADNSELSVFDKILVDIGDEQSIEQSLSTFSAHITNIIGILSQANDKSLVLIDELGAGTDPVEGAALAAAILEQLRLQGARIASTTHYAELKRFALETKGVENACCEFDVAALRPTYRLLIGMPGRSNAFAISERLGMKSDVVSRAKELVSNESSRFESVVQKLEESRSELDEKIKETEDLKLEVQSELEKARIATEQAEKSKQNELELARSQAENIIAKARSQVYGVLDELEAIRKKKEISAEERAKLRSDIRNMENAADPVRERSNDEYVLPRPLQKGDRVLIFDIDKEGMVLEVGKDNVLVQSGIIKTRVQLNNLRLLKQEKVKLPKRSAARTIRRDIKSTASTEVDVRGQVVLDAILDVDKAIDSAVLQGLHQITIIHGKGTGVLRKEIQKHLKTHPSVRTFRLGVFGEGDSGVTIAELK